ncbi:glycine N-acyltransferase-like protein Keg1 [Saccostrea cucullata]|uniref:glycine N-acyltransferase-like protein Keg1 n=1 Tax=Saccostrea cuccullata TaxID=36930 RepID=UPI002ED4EF13
MVFPKMLQKMKLFYFIIHISTFVKNNNVLKQNLMFFDKKFRSFNMDPYVILPEEEYPTLLEELKKQLPASLMAYYPLMLSQKNLFKKFKFVLVDEWPQFNCILEVENLPEDLSPHRVYGYCRREEFCVILNQMISQRLQKSTSSILLFGGPRQMKEILSMSGDEDAHNATISTLKCLGESKKMQDTKPSWAGGFDTLDLLIFVPFFSPGNVDSEVPSPFTATTIKREYMDLILSQWQYTGSYCDAKEFFTHTATTFESVCILNESGEPVAWGFEQHYGAIGMIHVLPEYRRKETRKCCCFSSLGENSEER